MKKILIFSIAYDPFIGGAEVAIQEITKRLPEDRFDLITLRYDSSLPRVEKKGNVMIHRIGFSKKGASTFDMVSFPLYWNKILFPLLAVVKAVKLHLRERYDLSWAMLAYAGFPALFFKWLFPTVPFVLTIQDGDSREHLVERKRIRIVGPIFRRIFKEATIVQAISHYLANFSKDMGATQERVTVIPNGADLSVFSKEYPREELETLKEDLFSRLPRGTARLLVTTSRLVPKNGVADLVASLKFLPDNVGLLVLGIGPLAESLLDHAEVMGVRNRVLFLGHIDNRDVPKYLKVSDIFVRPSLSEGLGVSFLEAMASRLPIIATPVGGIPDFLKDEETGLFCEPSNPESIAQKVKMLLENEKLREKIASNGYTLALREYSWDLVAERMRKEVFERVVRK